MGLILVCCLTLPRHGYAQTPLVSFGTRFLIAYPDTTAAHIGPFSPYRSSDVRLTIIAQDTADVLISSGQFTRRVTVVPRMSTTISLIDSLLRHPFIDLPDSVLPGAIEVSSDRPISLLCYFFTPDGSEAFVPLPVDQWGTEYFAVGLRNSLYFHAGNRGDLEENIYPDYAPGQILIIAAEDATDVTIEATTPTRRFSDTTVRLNAGEVYLVETADPWATTDTTSRDLSGTRLRSTRPIGVLSGNTRSTGGFGGTYLRLPTWNSLNNALIEWLPPASTGGNTFVYRPCFTRSNERTEEIVRVYATSPGITSVAASNGFPLRQMSMGEHLQYSFCHDSVLGTPHGAFNTPFALRTDRPATAMVVTASLAEPGGLLPDSSTTYLSWSPAMSLLGPREQWITYGRFHLPTLPTWIEPYVALVADSGARVWIDTSEVLFDKDPVNGTPFQHARVTLSTGDHVIRSVAGRCGAIAGGTLRGMEEFRPASMRKERAPELLHPSYYIQAMSVAYAFPIYGVDESRMEPDSLEFQRLDNCDSTVIVIRRVGRPWMMGPLHLWILPDSANAEVTIESDPQEGVPIGYRIRFRARDTALDATAKLVVESLGRTWTLPMARPSSSILVTPQPLEFMESSIGVERTIDVTLTNRREFVVTILSARLTAGDPPISLRGTQSLPRPILPNQEMSLVVAYTGLRRHTISHDTLVVETTCGTIRHPIRGAVGPDPLPTISGYDWRRRPVHSVNDTLSFIGNDGTRAYRIAEVALVEVLDSAFSLVPPLRSGSDSVEPSTLLEQGIRFAPPRAGEFTSRIQLVTTDADTVTAILHGEGVDPRLVVIDPIHDTLCLDTQRITSVRLRNVGSAPTSVQRLAIRPSLEVSVSIDTLTPFIPTVVDPGNDFVLPMTITPMRTGAYTIGLHLEGDVALDTVVADGVVTACIPPELVVTDHDFDSTFITLTAPGSVWVRNTGPVAVAVTGMSMVGDTSASFTVQWPTVPFDLMPGSEVEVRCSFTPTTTGPKGASIDYETTAGPRRSRLGGVGKKIRIPAIIRRDYHAPPGAEETIHLELQGSMDTLPVRAMELVVGYETGLLDYLAMSVPGAGESVQQWFGVHDGDSLRAHLAFSGGGPSADTLLSLRYLVRFSTIDSSPLPFTATVDLPYVEIVPEPGLFRRDPICGLDERLFVFTVNSFRLEQNRPNPFSRTTTIEFELPFADRTTLRVHNTFGDEVLRLVDEVLAPGQYSLTTPFDALPAGIYYYRLRSGPFVATRRMIAQ